ncbi:MAG: NUDIX hydrolase [Lachnospira sp.]|nr:NUDIX hydrolase [Lachnospira sp.]
MNHIKRVGRELKYKGSILNIYADCIKLPNGKVEQWDHIDHKSAAAVVPVLPDGRIILVRQFRNSLDRYTLEIPAGGVEPNESTRAAAKRELEEETGYKSDTVESLVNIVTAIAYCNEIVDIYVAKNLVQSKQNLDAGEDIDVEIYTVEELQHMIYTGVIMDSKTISAVLAYICKYVHKMK